MNTESNLERPTTLRLHEVHTPFRKLSRKEETAIFSRLDPSDQQQTDRIAKRHLPLVRICMKRFQGLAPDEDLFSAGCAGLAASIAGFRLGGAAFSTYASTCITNSILEHLAVKDGVNAYLVKQRGQVAGLIDRFQQENQTEAWPLTADMADEMGVSTDTVLGLMQSLRPIASLDATVGDDTDDEPLSALIPGAPAAAASAFWKADFYRRLMPLLGRYCERDRDIFCKAFGLCGLPLMPTMDIAAHYGLTPQRILQITGGILKDLRQHRELEELAYAA